MVHGSFSLVKWYLDCLDEDGRAVVGYWIEAAWQQASFSWESLDLYREALPPLRRWSIKRSPPPEVGAGIVWEAPGLGSAVTIEPRQPRFATCLLEYEGGTVDWAVEVPPWRWPPTSPTEWISPRAR